MSADDFAKRLGGTVGGRIDDNGHWECADCDASGYEQAVGGQWGLALYRHRMQNHVPPAREPR